MTSDTRAGKLPDQVRSIERIMVHNELKQMEVAWKALYGTSGQELLEQFIGELSSFRDTIRVPSLPAEWYKEAVVYSLYVDLFSHHFPGLEERLDYLTGLGVNCLWLLPILDSPMRDAGFDIRDYRKIRHDLLGLPEGFSPEEQERIFSSFLKKAHDRGIMVIFDIAINHTSEEHRWFSEARRSKDNPFRDYYIWSDDPGKYGDARIIFKGIEESNWKKEGEEYFFHRFFDFQPDLNYRNPRVLTDMAWNVLYWLKQGVDGFRADAIPYLWKEEGTTCENLPMTHNVVKFLRAVLEYIRPNTLLLAEACQKPKEVVKYFGDGDECNAGYHFPLMPQMFKALAMESPEPVMHTLSREVTPGIPDNAQWFTFLRCHDELSLELVYVTEEDRKYIHDFYCREPEWDFRLGQGISARLSELMERDPKQIGLIYSVMLTLPGTPVIYYGDEFGKLNDREYYREMIQVAGKDDSRFLVRGHINWDKVKKDLDDQASLSYKVFEQVKKMLSVRKKAGVFGQGSIRWLQIEDEKGGLNSHVLSYIREANREKIMVVQNLSGEVQRVNTGIEIPGDARDLLGKDLPIEENGRIALQPHSYFWIEL